MVSLVCIRVSGILRTTLAPKKYFNGVIYSTVKFICQLAIIDHSPSVPASTVIKRACFWVCDSYYNQQKKPSYYYNATLPFLNLPMDSNFLTPEQAITVVASLADEAGSMVALSFFYWAIEFPRYRHFMRLYIVSAICLIKNGNFERTHDVLRCMLRNFSEVEMLKEAVDMISKCRAKE